VRVLEEEWNILSGDVEAICRIAESNLDALNTADLGPKRLFSVGECALWAQFTGPQFAAQVGAVASLVEAPILPPLGYYGGQAGHGHQI
jgi:hypothetical protein